MNLALLVALRFSLGTGYFSIITRISVIGLALGVTALVVVVSVMNGFDSELRYRILGVVPHVVVDGEVNPDDARVMFHSRFLMREGLIVGKGRNRMVQIYGIDPSIEASISTLPVHVDGGLASLLVPGNNAMVIGRSLATVLGLWPSDSALVLIPDVSASGEGVVPRLARLTMTGTFTLGSELDYGLVVMHVADLREMVRLSTFDTRIRLNDIYAAEQVLASMGEGFAWTESYGDFFATVQMEKSMMFLLLVLIVMVASLNSISGLSMLVRNKRGEVAVMRTMGLLPHQIMQVFVLQGSLIGLLGVSVGILMGVLLATNVTAVVGFFEDMMGARVLAGTYFNRVPTDVRSGDVLVIAVISVSISFLATLYPAYRAARLEPATVLREF